MAGTVSNGMPAHELAERPGGIFDFRVNTLFMARVISYKKRTD